MLFVALMKARGGNPTETIGRRMHWQYPEGVRPIAEYWLQTTDPAVIAVVEADRVAPIMATTMPWTDAFEITVVPAITAEEGLRLAQQMAGR